MDEPAIEKEAKIEKLMSQHGTRSCDRKRRRRVRESDWEIPCLEHGDIRRVTERLDEQALI